MLLIFQLISFEFKKRNERLRKMKITILVLLICTGNLRAQTSEKPITLRTETGKIQGTLLHPDISKKVPLVLIIAGSGPTDRNGNGPLMLNNSLKMLAEGLVEKGIASVRYDKRGIGESAEAVLKESDLRFEHYIEDARSWIDTLKTDKRFSEIIVLGHSQGALIGMITAREKAVKKFISIAGISVMAGTVLQWQLARQPSIIFNEAKSIIESLEKGELEEQVSKELYPIFRPSVQPYMISWFKYEPQKELAKLNKPILVIQGNRDIQVDTSQAEKLVKSNKFAEKQIIEGMNHVLKDTEADWQKNMETYRKPDLPLKEGLIGVIVNFIE